jgi:hypothetical protein
LPTDSGSEAASSARRTRSAIGSSADTQHTVGAEVRGPPATGPRAAGPMRCTEESLPTEAEAGNSRTVRGPLGVSGHHQPSYCRLT